MPPDDDLSVRFNVDATGVQAGVDETKDGLTSISAVVDALTAQTAVLSAGFEQLGEQMTAAFARAKAGAAEGEVEIEGFIGQVHGAVIAVSEFKEAMEGLAALYLGAFAVQEIAEFIDKMGEAGERTEHTAAAFGMTTSEVQQLNAVMVQAGAGADALPAAMQRLDRAASGAVSGQQKAADAFKLIGVNLNEARTPAELFTATMQGIADLPGPEKATVAMALFGRNIVGLAGLLGMTEEQWQEMNAVAEQSGAVWPEATEKAAALGEQLNVNKVYGDAFNNMLADGLAPALTTVEQGIGAMAEAFVESYKQQGLVYGIMQLLVAVIEVLEAAAVVLGYGIATLGDIAVLSFQLFMDVITPVWNALVQLGNFVVGELSAAFGPFAQVVANAFNVVIQWVARAAEAIGNFLVNIPIIGPTFKAAGDQISATFSKMVTDANNAAAAIGRVLNPPTPAGLTQTTQRSLPVRLGGEKKDKEDPSQMGALTEKFNAQENTQEELSGGRADRADDAVAYWAEVSQRKDLSVKDQTAAQEKLQEALKASYEQEMTVAADAEASMTATAISGVNQRLSAEEEGNAAAMKAVETSVKDHQTSAAQGLAQEKALIDQRVSFEQAAALQILQLRTAADDEAIRLAGQDPVAVQKALDQQQKDYQTYATTITTIANTAAKARAAADTSAYQTALSAAQKTYTQIGDFARTTTEGLIEGTMTWQQAWTKILEGMLNLFLEWGEKQIVSWAATETAKSTATAAGTATRTATQAAGWAEGLAMDAANSLIAIANSAYVAAAGAYAALASIPIVGPVLAPVASAAALAAVIGLGTSIASAAGGWGQIPNDQMAMVHANEMILPASIANPLRSAISAGNIGGSYGAAAAGAAGGSPGGSGSGSGMNITVQSYDSKDMRRFVMENRGALRDALSREIRAGRSI